MVDLKKKFRVINFGMCHLIKMMEFVKFTIRSENEIQDNKKR